MADHRLFFSKTGTARYISHLDLMRTFQRAFLRAQVSIRHTEGFNPHAFVSILLPLSVGFSSQCEVLEFGLMGDLTMEEVPERLNGALPQGITVHSCQNAVLPAKRLTKVHYIATLDYGNGVPDGIEQAMAAALSQESWVIEKRSKKAKSGFTTVDIRPLIHQVSCDTHPDMVTLDMVLSAQNPGLNPELFLKAFLELRPEYQPDFIGYHRKAVLDESGNPFV